MASFAEQYGVRLPAAFAVLWRRVDGMDENDTDDELIRFWQLVEMKPVLNELPSADPDTHRSLFVFADWSISAYYYAIELSSENNELGAVSIVGGRAEPVPVAASFSEFLGSYLDDTMSVFAAGQGP